MYFIYIIYSESSNIFYVGYTQNYIQRLLQHNSDCRNTFTAKHRPWRMAAVFKVGENKKDAIKIERFIKKQHSRTFIQAIIQKDSFNGILEQLVRVPHMRD